MGYTDGLIAGLIIGWLIEWVIDWIFWRRRGRLWGKRPVELDAQGTSQRLTELERELELTRAKLAAAEQSLNRPRPGPNHSAGQGPQSADRLERVRGISPVYAGKLRGAGIHTFAQLAALTPAQIEDIIQVEGRQKIEPKRWIAQARTLAKEAAQTSRGAGR